MCSHCLAMSNSCINPIIYGIYNKKFQREYRRVFYTVFRLSSDGRRKQSTMSRYSAESGNNCDDHNDDMANTTHNFISSELGH